MTITKNFNKVHLIEALVLISVLGQLCQWIYRLILMMCPSLSSTTPNNQLFLYALVQNLTILVMVLLFLKAHRLPLTLLGLKKPIQSRWIQWAFVHGIGLFGIMMALSILTELLLPNKVSAQPITAIIVNAEGFWEKLIPFLVTGILAPIGEEILFRGFLFGTLRANIGEKAGVIVTSLLFGALHHDLWRVIPLTLGGFWLNLLSLRTQSLYPAIIAHSLWNCCMVIIIYII